MQEPLFSSTITYKLYNERTILIGTFVGGPLAGGYLLAQNFEALSEPAKAGKTWMVTIGVMLLLFGSAFVPAADAIPGIVYNLLFCCTAHFAARKYQGSRIALHQTNGGQFYSTWRAVLAGLVFLALMIGLILALYYLQDRFVF